MPGSSDEIKVKNFYKKTCIELYKAEHKVEVLNAKKKEMSQKLTRIENELKDN